jgi:hypothetical protein
VDDVRAAPQLHRDTGQEGVSFHGSGGVLAVTIPYLEPLIIVQNRRNKQTLTHAYTLSLLHLFLEKHVLQDTYPKISKNAQKERRKRNVEGVFSKVHNQKNWRSPPSCKYLGQAPLQEGPRPDH